MFKGTQCALAIKVVDLGPQPHRPASSHALSASIRVSLSWGFGAGWFGFGLEPLAFGEGSPEPPNHRAPRAEHTQAVSGHFWTLIADRLTQFTQAYLKVIAGCSYGLLTYPD